MVFSYYAGHSFWWLLRVSLRSWGTKAFFFSLAALVVCVTSQQLLILLRQFCLVMLTKRSVSDTVWLLRDFVLSSEQNKGLGLLWELPSIPLSILQTPFSRNSLGFHLWWAQWAPWQVGVLLNRFSPHGCRKLWSYGSIELRWLTLQRTQRLMVTWDKSLSTSEAEQ